MGFMIQGEIRGVDKIAKRLQVLANPTKALEKAVRKAKQVVLKAARAKCPIDDDPRIEEKGLLRQSLGIKVKSYGKTFVVGVMGPRRGYGKVYRTRQSGKNKGQPVFHDPEKIAHLVEHGHGGPSPAPEHPFMTPAWNETKLEQWRAMVKSMQVSLTAAGWQ